VFALSALHLLSLLVMLGQIQHNFIFGKSRGQLDFSGDADGCAIIPEIPFSLLFSLDRRLDML
jgi:hypothetical protein